MANKRNQPQGETTPQDFAQGTPRDLHPTSDIRFVMVEVGKLTANVERLIADVKSQGDKLDEIKDRTNFIKGAMWIGGLGLAAIISGAGWLMTNKWEQAAKSMKETATQIVHDAIANKDKPSTPTPP